jgi:phosphate transport system substrate-binding protein
VTVTPQRIRVGHSDSAKPLARALASAYQRGHPGSEVELVPRADRLLLPALVRGEVDVALLSWLPPDLPEGVWVSPFARDGLAVIVHPQNGLPGLTLTQAQELFQGRVEDFASWGGLPGMPRVVSREEASGDYALFQERVMATFPVALTALVAPSSDAMLSFVSEDPLAVGYVSTARLTPQVRPLAVEGVPPAPEMLASDVYPLTRDLYLATPGEPAGMARAFTQWVLGPEGQAVVRREGWLVTTD